MNPITEIPKIHCLLRYVSPLKLHFQLRGGGVELLESQLFSIKALLLAGFATISSFAQGGQGGLIGSSETNNRAYRDSSNCSLPLNEGSFRRINLRLSLREFVTVPKYPELEAFRYRGKIFAYDSFGHKIEIVKLKP